MEITSGIKSPKFEKIFYIIADEIGTTRFTYNLEKNFYLSLLTQVVLNKMERQTFFAWFASRSIVSCNANDVTYFV